MPIKGYTQMLGNFDCTWWPNLKNWVLPQPCIVKRASHEDNCLVGTQSPFLHPLERFKKEKKTSMEGSMNKRQEYKLRYMNLKLTVPKSTPAFVNDTPLSSLFQRLHNYLGHLLGILNRLKIIKKIKGFFIR